MTPPPAAAVTRTITAALIILTIMAGPLAATGEHETTATAVAMTPAATAAAHADSTPPAVTVERRLQWSCDFPGEAVTGVPEDRWTPPIGCESPLQDSVTPPRPVQDPGTPTTAVRPPRAYAPDMYGALLPLTDHDPVTAPVTRTVTC